MGLVDYADSDESEAEQPQPPKSQAPNPPAAKSGFQKVVDKSNPRKIKVELPGLNGASARNGGAASDHDGPPVAKRARTGGAFGGFNDLLPAPKNAGKLNGGDPKSGESGSSLKSRGLGLGLGRGVSLKTGAAPAFSRELPAQNEQEFNVESEDYDELGNRIAPQIDESTVQSEPKADESSTSKLQEEKPQPSRSMFRPLSVSRKPEKKKKKPLPEDQTRSSVVRTNGNPSLTSAVPEVAEAPQQPKPKKSLFATETDDYMETDNSNINKDEYQPLFEDEAAKPPEDIDHMSSIISEQVPNNNSNDLNSLANTLNLTPAQRRQLFGRSGAPSSAQVSQFSVSQEYSHNQAMLAAGEASAAAAPRAVRSIAPGKHSLQQLISQANSQKEALEESFQRGRANKKEAGSRYGWS